jgi:hypothetical protein
VVGDALQDLVSQVGGHISSKLLFSGIDNSSGWVHNNGIGNSNHQGGTEMTITAKFASKCSACGCAIAPGSKIEWSKGSPVRHVTCTTSAAAPAASKPATPGAATAKQITLLHKLASRLERVGQFDSFCGSGSDAADDILRHLQGGKLTSRKASELISAAMGLVDDAM